MEKYQITAITLEGLENVLQNELQKLGIEDSEVVKRAVNFEITDLNKLAELNTKSKLALRFLLELNAGIAVNDVGIYELAKSVDWENWFTLKNTFSIRATVYSDNFKHSGFVGLKVKDAVADRFRDKFGKRPSVNTENPEIQIYVQVSGDSARIGLDSSGITLSKRGYRIYPGKAPLSEVLGAGLVALSEWTPEIPLFDAMCGSGTISLEAITGALGKTFRKMDSFSMKNWLPFQHSKEIASTETKLENLRVTTSDVSLQALRGAQYNAEKAGVKELIKFQKQDFFKAKPPYECGMLIINPPYGERLELSEAEAFYKSIGDKLKADYKGWTAWIFCSNNLAAKKIGLKPSKKIKLYNGQLDCLYLKFEIFDGNYKTMKALKSEKTSD